MVSDGVLLVPSSRSILSTANSVCECITCEAKVTLYAGLGLQRITVGVKDGSSENTTTHSLATLAKVRLAPKLLSLIAADADDPNKVLWNEDPRLDRIGKD